MGAQVKIVGAAKEKIIPLEKFFILPSSSRLPRKNSSVLTARQGIGATPPITAKQAGELALDCAKLLKDNIYKVNIAQDLIQRGLLASV